MWFAVSVFMKSISLAETEDQALWEESIVLVDADDEHRARTFGENFGRDAEHEYETASGDFLRWRFACVERVYPIDTDDLSHGTEIFSRFLRASEAASLLTPFDEV